MRRLNLGWIVGLYIIHNTYTESAFVTSHHARHNLYKVEGDVKLEGISYIYAARG